MADIIVMGGGVAGLAAAYALAPFHKVTVLETTDTLGGVGVTLSCKAGYECSVCAACTLPDLIEAVEAEPNVTIRTGVEVEEFIQTGDRVELVGTGERFSGDAIIVATGFSVADGSELAEYGSHLDGVTTALELDRSLRGGGHGGDGPAIPEEGGSVAFIQCVCSRDTGELPYCSRVCCAYTARLALELRERYSDLKVTVFYMDLQREDPVAALQMDAAIADDGIEYIRSRPAMVQDNPGGGVEVLYEDTIDGEIRSGEFDMVVLSTGVVPSEGTRRSIDLLGLEADEQGFISRPGDDPSATSSPRVFAAGSATGPVDLVEAAMGGMAAAASVLRRDPPDWTGYPPRVIVVGEEPGVDVIGDTVKAAGADAVTILGGPGKGLQRLEGEPLAFLARMGRPGGETTINVKGDVVVISPLSGNGGSAIAGGRTFSEVERDLAKGSIAGSSRFCLLMGDDATALGLARTILKQHPDSQVDVLFQELAVAEEGMQDLQMELADKGVRFIRYSRLQVSGEGPIEVTFVDELAPELGELSIDVDVVATEGGVGDDDLVWPWFLSRYAPKGVPTELRLNVLPVMTPRRGVYTAVPATRTGTSMPLGGAAATAMALSDFARGFPLEPEVAEVDPDACAACLNCLRVCPHDAIVFNEPSRAAVVMPRACQACGLCRSICPAQAISFVPSDQLEVD